MTLISYAASSSYEHAADARIADLPPRFTPHISVVDPFNHATARNASLDAARELGADWLVWMDADWILDTCVLHGSTILQGRIKHYPTAAHGWRRASVFAVPRALFDAIPRWDDEHFTNYWADIHWACVLCKRARLPIRQCPTLKVLHIPHAIKQPNRAWHRAHEFYEQEKLSLTRPNKSGRD